MAQWSGGGHGWSAPVEASTSSITDPRFPCYMYPYNPAPPGTPAIGAWPIRHLELGSPHGSNIAPSTPAAGDAYVPPGSQLPLVINATPCAGFPGATPSSSGDKRGVGRPPKHVSDARLQMRLKHKDVQNAARCMLTAGIISEDEFRDANVSGRVQDLITADRLQKIFDAALVYGICPRPQPALALPIAAPMGIRAELRLPPVAAAGAPAPVTPLAAAAGATTPALLQMSSAVSFAPAAAAMGVAPLRAQVPGNIGEALGTMVAATAGAAPRAPGAAPVAGAADAAPRAPGGATPGVLPLRPGATPAAATPRAPSHHHKRYRDYGDSQQTRIFKEALPLLEELQVLTGNDLSALVVTAMKRVPLFNVDEFAEALVNSNSKRIKSFVNGMHKRAVSDTAAEVHARDIAMALHRSNGGYKVWLELQKVLKAAGFPVSVSGVALTEISKGMKVYLDDLLAVTDLPTGYGFETVVNLLQLSAQRSLVGTNFLKERLVGNLNGYLTPRNNSYPLLIHLDALMTGGHKYLSVMLNMMTDAKDAHKMKNQMVTMICKGGDGHKNLKQNLVRLLPRAARCLAHSERPATDHVHTVNRARARFCDG